MASLRTHYTETRLTHGHGSIAATIVTTTMTALLELRPLFVWCTIEACSLVDDIPLDALEELPRSRPGRRHRSCPAPWRSRWASWSSSWSRSRTASPSRGHRSCRRGTRTAPWRHSVVTVPNIREEPGGKRRGVTAQRISLG